MLRNLIWVGRESTVCTAINVASSQTSLQQKSQLSKTLLATWYSHFINQLTRVLVLKMSLSRPSNAYDALAPSESFFEREKARLIEEISTVWSSLVYLLKDWRWLGTKNFEELMGNMNTLNRTLEQVYGVGREFTMVSSLWGVSRWRNRWNYADVLTAF